MAELTIWTECFPVAGSFTIARDSRTEIDVVSVELTQGNACGRGECRPYARYGESSETVRNAIEGLRAELEAGLTRSALGKRLGPGAARNALDCALWDLESKRGGQPVWRIAGLAPPAPLTTAYTISLDDAETMATAAGRAGNFPILKVKLGAGSGDIERIRAVRASAPDARLIVDANEGWTAMTLRDMLPHLAVAGVELVEQPLPAEADGELLGFNSPIPLCADESCHDRASLSHLVGKYDWVNIKLDKTGGLTEALALAAAARDMGFRLLVGCMVGTSLGIAPAVLLGQMAELVDLDGPLLLGKDRDPALRYDGATLHPPDPALWG